MSYMKYYETIKRNYKQFFTVYVKAEASEVNRNNKKKLQVKKELRKKELGYSTKQ